MRRKNHYIVLGVKQSASHGEIKVAYRNLAKKYHPDRNNDNGASEELFKEIHIAYSILSDPQKRQHYNLSLPLHEKHAPFNSHVPYNSPYAFSKAAYSSRQSHNADASADIKEKRKAYSGDLFTFLISGLLALIFLLFVVFYNV